MHSRSFLQSPFLKQGISAPFTRPWLTHCAVPSAPSKIAPRYSYPILSQIPQHTGQTEASFASTASVVVAAAGLVSASIYLYQYIGPPKARDLTEEYSGFGDTREQTIMADASPPGRPGNLTAEQEARLREMWAATLTVFGVPGPGDANKGGSGEISSTKESEALEQADMKNHGGTLGSGQKRKKRIGMFSRRNHDDAASDNLDGALTIDGDDKYGQTKAYHKMLDSQSPEDLRKAFWSMVKHDNPDGLLLRFLRARKWDVQNALTMLVAAMHWRMQEMHVDDDIIRKGEAGSLEDTRSSNPAVKKEGEDFLTQMKLGKSFLHGTDREGRPMCFVRVRLHKQGEQSEASVERFTVYTIETARYLLDFNVDTAAVVFDMTEFSMANMDYGPVRFMIKCFEANYPESLGVVLVHKSPWIFSSVWKIIKGWLDPVVAGKVHFTKNVEELEAFIEKGHIPKELGGSDPWTYRYIEPVSGENSLMSDDNTRNELLDERAMLVTEFERTTQQWIHDSVSQGSLQQKRSALTERLRSGYWKLDPYLRARSFYDRTGMIREGGKIQYYQPFDSVAGSDEALAPSVQNGPFPAVHRVDDLD